VEILHTKQGCSSPLLEYHYECLVCDPAKIFLHIQV
jgi:hypothetical protein